MSLQLLAPSNFNIIFAPSYTFYPLSSCFPFSFVSFPFFYISPLFLFPFSHMSPQKTSNNIPRWGGGGVFSIFTPLCYTVALKKMKLLVTYVLANSEIVEIILESPIFSHFCKVLVAKFTAITRSKLLMRKLKRNFRKNKKILTFASTPPRGTSILEYSFTAFKHISSGGC